MRKALLLILLVAVCGCATPSQKPMFKGEKTKKMFKPLKNEETGGCGGCFVSIMDVQDQEQDNVFSPLPSVECESELDRENEEIRNAIENDILKSVWCGYESDNKK